MSVETPVRAFFAAPLPATAAHDAAEAAGRLIPSLPGRWRPLPPDRLHLTLRFLGDVPAETLPALEELLARVCSSAGPAEVTLAGTLLLPAPRRPHVLAFSVSDPTDTLRRLADALEGGLRPLGLAGEDRPFLAHLTVARATRPPRADRGTGGGRGAAVGAAGKRGRLPSVDGPASLNGGAGAAAAQAVRGPRFTVGRVALFRSVLRPGGAEHTVLAERPLTGAGARPPTGTGDAGATAGGGEALPVATGRVG